MRITVYASGSSGNCALAEAAGARILVDAGLSLRRLKAFLAMDGLRPADIDAVFITHEHRDHISGLPMLEKYHGLPAYALGGVARRLEYMLPELAGCVRPIRPGESAVVAGARLTPFETEHDTPASAGCRIDTSEGAMGFCTDLGEVTGTVEEALRGVKAALIEANHDEEMLRYGPYPAILKRRILSKRGHLSNADSARLAVFLAANGADTIILGHLSRENNSPDLAYGTVKAALDAAGAAAGLLVAPPLGPLSAELLEKCPA